MKKVIEDSYEDPLDEVFETFDPVPIAAASIGQVYKARMHDGRDVAVKVQYPGVASAVRADMQNLGMILRLMKRIAPGLDPRRWATRSARASTRSSTTSSRRPTSARSRGSSAAIRSSSCPTSSRACRASASWSSEFVSGRGFEEIKQLPQAERDRIGEMIFRFYFGCMYRHHQFSGDPHPGNSLLLDDGRMAFLDFGLFKRIPAEVAEFELQSQRLGIEGRSKELIELLHNGGFIGDPSFYTEDKIMAQFRDLTWWYTDATRRSCSRRRSRPR